MTQPTHPEFSILAEEIPGVMFVDHVAIAVPQGTLDEQVAAYSLLGFKEIHRETATGSDQVRECLLRVGTGPNLIQLTEPLSPESPVQKAIDRNGGKGGLNHIAFRVRDIHAAFKHLKEKGFQIIDDAPRPGSRGTTVFFIHPKGLVETPLNVLIEFVQE